MLIRLLVVFAMLVGLVARGDDSPPNAKPVYQAKSMSQEEFARVLAQSKHYTFDLASPDGLVDQEGVLVRAENVMAYLREKKLDPSAYFLLEITPASPKLDTIAPTVDPIGRFGATKEVVRQKTDGPPIPIVREFRPAPGTPPDRKPSTMVIVGKPNRRSLVSGQPFPDLSGRPVELRPEALPRGVRYAFGSDQAMIDAEVLVKDHLLAPSSAATVFFGKSLQVQAGAWKQLKSHAKLGKKSAVPVSGVVLGKPGEATSKKLQLQNMVLGDPAELALVEASLRKTISDDGGGQVRAMKNREMARWWPFITFDLVEPLLVIETKNGAHLFALSFDGGTLVAIDDLNGLPPVSALVPKPTIQ